ncbi:MAG TPA: periplasmic heavy metal sensor [Phycisphaerae bacterium]|nr:periplasmic heavy metal sensor [Phycisphaerae bacterium]HRW54966.1 periplasmic heavy metal sensor [Phycisphaerae bacterium]
MKAHGKLTLVVVFVACSLGGFIAAYAWQPGAGRNVSALVDNDPLRVLGGWLRLAPDQVAELSRLDPTFAAERDEMEADLAAERERLASMFENATASDEAIMAQVEKVIEIHDALERRVAAYLLALRPRLTSDQRAKFFERCGEEVRQVAGWRRGGGRGYGGPPADRGPASPGAGRGRGGGPPWSESGRDSGARRGPSRGGR